MKRVLVTGGSGYIGSALVPHLLQRNYAVTVLSRRDVPRATSLTAVVGDIRDEVVISQSLEGCDYIIHLAGVPDGKDPETDKSINQKSFPAILRACKKAGIGRFLYISTAALYGSGGEAECREDAPVMPLSGYAEHKRACEEMLLAHTGDMERVILRPGAVCGLAPSMRFDLLVHKMTRDAITTGEITVQSGGNWRPHLHIQDMVTVCVELLAAPHASGEIFNAASENLTLLALAEKIRAIIGTQVKITRLPGDDRRSYRISSNKLKEETGFVPLYSVDAAIERLQKAFADGILSDRSAIQSTH
jgi:nucleoside-diphosphate-sugar epimerase